MENLKQSIEIINDVTGVIDVESKPSEKKVVILALSFQPLKEILGLKLEFFTSMNMYSDEINCIHTLELFY